MNSMRSILTVLAATAALGGAANAAADTQPAPAPVSAATALASAGATVMPAAVFAAGAGSASTVPHAASFGAAAATGEEALPESNIAMLLLAALAAMGSVVIRRSGGR